MTTYAQIKIDCINNMGGHDHPVATLDNLRFFEPDYVLKCLYGAVLDPRTSDATKQAAQTAIDLMRDERTGARCGINPDHEL